MDSYYIMEVRFATLFVLYFQVEVSQKSFISTEIDWKDEWFAMHPREFWKSSTESHRKYLLSFAKKYNIVQPSDWGNIRTRHIIQEKGSGLLKEYGNSYYELIFQLL